MQKRGEYDINKDYIKGQEGESFVAEFLEKKFGFQKAFASDGKNYDFKMLWRGKIISFEIKTDFYHNTGNIAIEYSSRGKPSGISVSKAFYYVNYFYHLGEIWIIKMDELKKLLKRKDVPGIVNKKNVGDKNSQTHIFLVNKENSRHFFKIYKTT